MSEVMREVRKFIRNPYSWPGGYPLVLLMHDGETICTECARSEYRQISRDTRHNLRDSWQAVGVKAHMEGPPETCAHCGKETASAYGEEVRA